METDRSHLCGCKGVRSCLICEHEYGIPRKSFQVEEGEKSFIFCPYCNKFWPGVNPFDYEGHPNHSGRPFNLPGILISLNFITEEEEDRLLKSLDEIPWDVSQSGRRKQNFGPKCNFKKKKLQLGDFRGFPKCTQFIQDRFSKIDLLKNYITIEQCSLEYDPERGASIDPHIDDCWIWGERIVTVNLNADSVLTMRPNTKNRMKYNLKFAPPKFLEDELPQNIVLRIPLPQRSLIVLYNKARYNWEHFVCREDVKKRRVCLAYREFTPPYLPGGHLENESKDILIKANHFWIS